MGVIAYLGPNPRHPHVDGAVLAVVADATQLGKDFFAGQHPTGVAGQQPQKVELGAGQIDTLALEPGLAGGVVDFQVLERQAAFAADLGSVKTTQQGTHACQQYPRLHRLRHIIVGAHLEPQDLIHVVGPRGQHQDRTTVVAANTTTDRQAILARQHQIQNHQIRLQRQNTIDAATAVILQAHSEAVGFEVVPRQTSETLIIFDDKYVILFSLL